MDQPKASPPNLRLPYAGIVGNGRIRALVDGCRHFAARGTAGIHVSVPERYQGQVTGLNHAH